MRFEYCEESEDKLSKKTWWFALTDDCNIVLDSYYEYSRHSKRHKYRLDKEYNRIMGRDNNIELNDVIVTYKIAENITDQINAKLTFFSDWHGREPIIISSN